MCFTWLDKIRNEYVRESLTVASAIEKIRSARLFWYGYARRKDERHMSRDKKGYQYDFGWT